MLFGCRWMDGKIEPEFRLCNGVIGSACLAPLALGNGDGGGRGSGGQQPQDSIDRERDQLAADSQGAPGLGVLPRAL